MRAERRVQFWMVPHLLSSVYEVLMHAMAGSNKQDLCQSL